MKSIISTAFVAVLFLGSVSDANEGRFSVRSEHTAVETCEDGKSCEVKILREGDQITDFSFKELPDRNLLTEEAKKMALQRMRRGPIGVHLPYFPCISGGTYSLVFQQDLYFVITHEDRQERWSLLIYEDGRAEIMEDK